MQLCLYHPDIAGNVGTILRTAACFGVPVHIVEPCGFAYGDRALRRAGMDYAIAAPPRLHADWAAFVAAVPGRRVLLSTAGAVRIDAARFVAGDVLVLGSEGAGVPDAVRADVALAVRIPMLAGRRSLNVAVAAGIALGEALRQTAAFPLG